MFNVPPVKSNSTLPMLHPTVLLRRKFMFAYTNNDSLLLVINITCTCGTYLINVTASLT